MKNKKPQKWNTLWWSVLVLVIAAGGVFIFFFVPYPGRSGDQSQISPNGFVYYFNKNMTLRETHTPEESVSPFWWVSSGGEMRQKNGTGSTIVGALPGGGYWQERYEKNNPEETGGGKYPQNVFRMVTKSVAKNFAQSVSFKILHYRISDDSNRNQTNGIHLFNRYQDQDNLYYTGIRADGMATIKKKFHGNYTTLSGQKVWSGEYDREKNPMLIPLHHWMGIKSVVKTQKNGDVLIILFIDPDDHGDWQEVARAIDDGSYDGPPITAAGRNGIRTDFSDVLFRDFEVKNLP